MAHTGSIGLCRRRIGAVAFCLFLCRAAAVPLQLHIPDTKGDLVGKQIGCCFQFIMQQLFYILNPIVYCITVGISGTGDTNKAPVIGNIAAEGFHIACAFLPFRVMEPVVFLQRAQQLFGIAFQDIRILRGKQDAENTHLIKINDGFFHLPGHMHGDTRASQRLLQACLLYTSDAADD